MRRYLLQALLGLVAAALTFDLSHLSVNAGAVVICLFPGMLMAMAITGNVHAWPIWIAALGNFLFYFLLT
jgi:hypothetical protein